MRYRDITIGQTFISKLTIYYGKSFLLSKTTEGLMANNSNSVSRLPHNEVRKDDVYKIIRLK